MGAVGGRSSYISLSVRSERRLGSLASCTYRNKELSSDAHSSAQQPYAPDTPWPAQAESLKTGCALSTELLHLTARLSCEFTAAWERQREHRPELRSGHPRLRPGRQPRRLQQCLLQRPLPWAPGEPSRLPGLQERRRGLPPSLLHQLQRCGNHAAPADAAARDLLHLAKG